MPIYDIKNNETGEEKEVVISYSALQEMKTEGSWSQIHKSTPMVVTHIGGTLKQTSGDWKNLLERVKKGSGENCTVHV